MNTHTRIAKLSFLLLTATAASAHAHEHLAAGVNNSGQKLQLYDESNVPIVSGSLSGRVFHMTAVPAGQNYGGYFALDEFPNVQYPNDYFVFAALSDGQTEFDGPYHAPTGSDIWMQITSITGPAGAHFGFWENDWSYFNTTPTISLQTNTATGGFKFELTEPDPYSAPGDPYGHIHNRGFTVDQPGDYYVGFTLVDTSSLVANSETYTFHFLAVPEPGSTGLSLAGVASLLSLRRKRNRR